MARQVWVKCGTKTGPLELEDETPEEIERNVRRRVKVNSSEKVYVLCQGKVVQWSKWMEMEEGCIFEVMLPMKAGGKQKQKKEKKQVVQPDDGMCAIACEQLRLLTERMNEATEEDKRCMAEHIENVRKVLAVVEEKVKGEDVQRMAEVEEGLEKLEEKMRPWSVEEQEQRRR